MCAPKDLKLKWLEILAHLYSSLFYIMWYLCYLMNFSRCVAFTLCKRKGKSWRQNGLCLAINLITVISRYMNEVRDDASAFLNEGRLSLTKDRRSQLLNRSEKPGEHYWLLAMRDPELSRVPMLRHTVCPRSLSKDRYMCITHIMYWLAEKNSSILDLCYCYSEQRWPACCPFEKVCLGPKLICSS